jgi:hypothetical protein
MMDRFGSQASKLPSRSRLPAHSSLRVTTRWAERVTIDRVTVRRGRSSHTTVSARAHTMSRTAE